MVHSFGTEQKNGYLNHTCTFVTGHVYQKNTNLRSVTQNPLLKMETNIAMLELLEEETFKNFWTDVEIVILFIKLWQVTIGIKEHIMTFKDITQ